jgi:nitrogen fixation NifU-like protein
MTTAQILYQGEILKYGRKPNNFGVLDDANIQLHGDSPICGDHMRLYLRVNSGHIEDVRFSSSACCALCMASSSMMTDAIKGLSISNACNLRTRFLALIAGENDPAATPMQDLGKLHVFERIREVPSRIECVSLAWNTLDKLLAKASIEQPENLVALTI